MFIQRLKLLPALLAGAVALVASGTTMAAGFAIIEHSAKGIGTAFAGGAAAAEDTSTVWFNPAGMTKIQGTQIDTVGHIIFPSSDFSNGASVVNPAFTGGAPVPLPGATSDIDPGVAALVPNFYYVRELRPNLNFGLGVNAPFGLKTTYDGDWVGRYHALTSSLKTINVNPGLSYNFRNGLTIGGGASVQYIEARLSNAIDKAGVCIGGLTPLLGVAGAAGTCGGAGLPPAAIASGTTDGFIDLDADDISYGFNVGILYEFSPATRIGAHWRSKISHTLKGDAEFTGTGDLAAIFGGGRFTDQTASAKVTLPESLSLSGFHQVNSRLALMADFTWTRWNRFQQLVIVFDGGHPTNVTPEEWNNSVRVAGGASYKYNDRWTFRGGLAWDEEPIPNAELRTPRIPGEDRFWVAIGASFNHSDKLSFDVGYAHLFVGDVPINNTEVNTGHVLVGTYDADVNILSAQLRYRFK